MEHLSERHDDNDLQRDVEELRCAVAFGIQGEHNTQREAIAAHRGGGLPSSCLSIAADRLTAPDGRRRASPGGGAQPRALLGTARRRGVKTNDSARGQTPRSA